MGQAGRNGRAGDTLSAKAAARRQFAEPCRAGRAAARHQRWGVWCWFGVAGGTHRSRTAPKVGCVSERMRRRRCNGWGRRLRAAHRLSVVPPHVEYSSRARGGRGPASPGPGDWIELRQPAICRLGQRDRQSTRLAAARQVLAPLLEQAHVAAMDTLRGSAPPGMGCAPPRWPGPPVPPTGPRLDSDSHARVRAGRLEQALCPNRRVAGLPRIVHQRNDRGRRSRAGRENVCTLCRAQPWGSRRGRSRASSDVGLAAAAQARSTVPWWRHPGRLLHHSVAR